MQEFGSLPDSILNADIEKKIAIAKLLLRQLEVMIRDSPSDEVCRSHVIYRLRELECIALECLKGLPP